MSDTWTPEDALAASREGWDLFECSGSDDGPLQLQKIDDPQAGERAWEADTDAWVFVAQSESPLHVKALGILREVNPVEYEAIEKWIENLGKPEVTA